MPKLTVALLSGGISAERQVSLNSGEQVFQALDKEKYEVRRYDPKTDIPALVADAAEIDVALIVLHGPYGEDGTVQGLLELLGIPYQGAGVLASAVAMDKYVAKQLYRQAGLNVPRDILIQRSNTPQSVRQCLDQLGLPLVVKPASGGSSVGISIVRHAGSLQAAVDQALQFSDTVMVEAFIDGLELTVGVIGNDELEALPVIEIIPDDSCDFFDYRAKYTAGVTREICPARIDADIARQASEMAKAAHGALCCRGYSRSDMILHDGGLYLLETNTIPGMTENSLLPLAARTAGITFSRLMDRLINLSLEDHARAKGNTRE